MKKIRACDVDTALAAGIPLAVKIVRVEDKADDR